MTLSFFRKCAFNKDGTFLALITKNLLLKHDVIELWDMRGMPVAITFLPIPALNADESLTCVSVTWSDNNNNIAVIFGPKQGKKGEKGGGKSIKKEVTNHLRYLFIYDIYKQSLVVVYGIPVPIQYIQFLPDPNVGNQNIAANIGIHILLGTYDIGSHLVLNLLTGSLHELHHQYQSHDDTNALLYTSFKLILPKITENIINCNADSNNTNLDENMFLSRYSSKLKDPFISQPSSECICIPNTNKIVLIANDVNNGEAKEMLLIQITEKDSSLASRDDDSYINFVVLLRHPIVNCHRVASISINSDCTSLLYTCNDYLLRVVKLETLEPYISYQKGSLTHQSSSAMIGAFVKPLVDTNTTPKEMIVIIYPVYIQSSLTGIFAGRAVFVSVEDLIKCTSNPYSQDALDLDNKLLSQSFQLPYRGNGVQSIAITPSFDGAGILPCKSKPINSNKLYIVGIDGVQALAYTQKIKSEFGGPMYPVGFILMDRVRYHVEAEDELDNIVIPSTASHSENNHVVVDSDKQLSNNLATKMCKLVESIDENVDVTFKPMVDTNSNVADWNYNNVLIYNRVSLHKLPPSLQQIDVYKSQLELLLNYKKPISATQQLGDDENGVTITDMGATNINFAHFFVPPRKVLTGDIVRKRDKEEKSCEDMLLCCSNNKLIIKKLDDAADVIFRGTRNKMTSSSMSKRKKLKEKQSKIEQMHEFLLKTAEFHIINELIESQVMVACGINPDDTNIFSKRSISKYNNYYISNISINWESIGNSDDMYQQPTTYLKSFLRKKSKIEAQITEMEEVTGNNSVPCAPMTNDAVKSEIVAPDDKMEEA